MDQAQKMDVLSARHDAMQTILTDPDHLANYTDRYFTEVVPVDIDGDTQAYQGQQQAYQPRYDMPAPPANWRVLQQMGPEAMRSKLLFMDPA